MEKAKALLKEAGYGNGLSITIKTPQMAYASRSAELISAMLSEVGVDMKIIPTEFPAKWIEEVFKNKDYDVTIVSHTEPLDIDIFARDTYYFNYKNDRFKAAVRRSGQDHRREGALRQICRGPEDPGRGRARPLPVPAAEARRVEREGPGPVGELADPVERRDGSVLERVSLAHRVASSPATTLHVITGLVPVIPIREVIPVSFPAGAQRRGRESIAVACANGSPSLALLAGDDTRTTLTPVLPRKGKKAGGE